MPTPSDHSDFAAIQVWRIELDDGGRERARAALGQILADRLGVAEPPALIRALGGKPRLACEPGRLAFSLAHSGTLALVAIGPEGTSVGVDIERVKPRRDLVRLAHRWLPAADARAVAAAPAEGRDIAFHAAWTRHEARVKCTGAGLGGPTPGPEVVAHDLAIDTGYAAAVATTIATPRIVIRTFAG